MSPVAEFATYFPPARARAQGPRIELRLPSDAELLELAALAAAGIHPPETMPFAMPWSDHPPRDIARNLLTWHWSQRAAWAPAKWNLLLVAFLDGRPIGAQDLAAANFGVVRSVSSGSWIGREFQGRGLGTEMREVLLGVAFDGLGAATADSGAYSDNPASIRVSEKVGYRANGEHTVLRTRGPRAPGGVSSAAAIELRFRLDADSWRARTDRPKVELHGFDDAEVRTAFGIG